MKTIIFLRHGKATEKGPHIDDRSRPTTPEGDDKTRHYSLDLQHYLQHTRHEDMKIDAIVSSAALRARMTAEVAASVFHFSRNAIIYDPRLWTSDAATIIELINTGLHESRDTVVLVGHNIEMSQAANIVSSDAVGYMKKSTYAIVHFEANTRADVSSTSFSSVVLIPEGHHPILKKPAQ